MCKEYYGFIYLTTNKINGMKYVGKKKYIRNWESYLGSGIRLKYAIDKYGKENFTKEIIENVLLKEEINAREKYWIDYYNAVESKDFYNISLGGDGGDVTAGYTVEMKAELSLKFSKGRKGIVNQNGNNPNAKKVICLNTMEIFDTTVLASKYASTRESNIQNCCRIPDKIKTAGTHPITGERLQWAYYNKETEYVFEPFKREYKTGVYGKKVICLETGITYNSITEGAKSINRKEHSLCSHLNGVTKTCGGLHWKYLDNI